MGSLRIGGIASGIDTEGLIQQLLAIERRPQVLLERRVSILNWQQEYWQEINTKLLALQTALKPLFDPDQILAHTATTDNDNLLTATASGNAQAGQYQVTIQQIATATQLMSGQGALGLGLGAPIDPSQALTSATNYAVRITKGTFTINGQEFTINDGDSLNDILTQINSADVGVNITYLADVDRLRIEVTTPDGEIKLGTLGDTSNFFSATGLIAAPTQDADGIAFKESTTHLGTVNPKQKLATANFATQIVGDAAGNGKFKINGVEIAYNVNKDTLETVLARINASQAGVIARYDHSTDRLTLTAKQTGNIGLSLEDVEGNFLAAVDCVEGTHTQVEKLGKNAILTIQGLNNDQPFYRTSNIINDIIAGVTLNLQRESVTPVNLNVTVDSTQIKQTVKDFVAKYNEAIGLITNRLRERSVTGKQWEEMTTAERKQGLLSGNQVLRQVRQVLMSLVSSPIPGLDPAFDQLADFGITIRTGPEGGTLDLDESLLDQAITTNPEAISRLFAASNKESGVAVALDTYLAEVLSTKSVSYGGVSVKEGLIPRQPEMLRSQVNMLEDQLEMSGRRLEMRQQQLIRQFTALEQALAQLQNQSVWLAGQLASLMNPVR